MTDDAKLLRDYAKHGSEAAFGELVARYVDLVYSTALRQVNGDTHLAQDVTQSVFIDLARRAAHRHRVGRLALPAHRIHRLQGCP